MHKYRIIGTSLPPMPFRDWMSWKIMGLYNRIDDRFWERRLGINTVGKVMVHQPGAHWYGTFAYRPIFKILQRLNLTGNDVFVDIGCGKGRVVCCAAMFGIRKSIGVELDETLCRAARENTKQLRTRRSSIEIIHAPAQECDYRECNKFFLFNPFGEQTLRQVVEAISRSMEDQPRPIELAYVNPAYDHVLEEHPRFEQFGLWRWRPWNGLKFDVSFWRWG